MARKFGKWFAAGIAHFESSGSGGIILRAERDSGGVWTGPNGIITYKGQPVYEGQVWTLDEAVEVYNIEMGNFARHIEQELGNKNDIVTQVMFDGLGLLCWNIGRGAFSRSTVLREIHNGNLEDAAAAFLKWRGDTMHGGNAGPDGRPVRGPDGKELPRGVAWFKLFGGLYRRSMYGALLFMKREPDFASDSRNIKLGKMTTTRPDSEYYYYDVMIPEQTTSWRDALDASAPIVEEAAPEPVPAPAPVTDSDLPVLPGDWEQYTDAEKVAWLNTGQLRELQQRGGDPVSPQVTPVKKVRPVTQVRPASEVPYLTEEAKANPQTKRVGESKRGNGYANKKIGGVMGTVAVAGMAADQIGAVEPVLKAANTYGVKTIGTVLLIALAVGLLAYIWGMYLQRWGEEDADTYLE